MSHTTKIQGVKIMNVSALHAAVAELNETGVKCSLIEGGTPRAYSSNQSGMGKADLVLRLDGSNYDVGFYKQADGSYEPRTDFFGGRVEALIGAKATAPERAMQAKMGKLFQLYGAHAVMQAARSQGKTIRRMPANPETGEVQLIVEGY